MYLKSCLLIALSLLVPISSWAGRATIRTVATSPYASAMVIDAESGKTLFAKNIDAEIYPASTLKLMVLLVILDRIEQGILDLSEMVQITTEASKMGGSQVYLDPKEQFSIDELLYALMIQSANDAAVALAIHVAGTKEDFVGLMNQMARKLGMKETTFYSVHGLPPGKGQRVDVSTARDFAILCRTLSKMPAVFKYTAAKIRPFREGKFIMRTHNHLLNQVTGCDGFKTGYFTKAGFSIAATARQKGHRLIVIVMGSKDRLVRDATAARLLAQGFAKLSSRQSEEKITIQPPTPSLSDRPSIPLAPPLPPARTAPQPDDAWDWGSFFWGLGLGFALYAVLHVSLFRKRRRGNGRRHKLF